jgi:hypothetical protein
MVRTMKKVRFDERVTILNVTAIEEVSNSLLESNFNHECHEEEEDVVAIESELSNELSHLSVLPTVDECHEEEDPAAIHLPVLPTVESTVFSNFSYYSNAISDGSSNIYRSRWMTSNNEVNDEPPILPLRQGKETVDNIIKSALSVLDQSQDALPPSNDYTSIWARAA